MTGDRHFKNAPFRIILLMKLLLILGKERRILNIHSYEEIKMLKTSNYDLIPVVYCILPIKNSALGDLLYSKDQCIVCKKGKRNYQYLLY